MKLNILIFVVVSSAGLLTHNMFAQSNLPAKASISDLTYKGAPSGEVVYAAGDHDQPPVGQVMVADWKNLQACNQKIAHFLASAPDDDTGKRSAWHGQLLTWKALFDKFLISKTQASLFALTPTMALYVSRNDGTATLSPQMESIDLEMRGMGYYIIRAMANHVTEQRAAISATNLDNFVRVFFVPGFIAEGDWESEKIPIDAAGVMILDATAVATQLKSEPWQQAQQFLGGAMNASDFFTRYNGSGDGLAVLKTKYAVNQSVIDTKFVELKTWADQQERQAGGIK